MDVIISEWMVSLEVNINNIYYYSMNVIIALCGPQGYFLLFESMLDTVLFARDKWLKDSSQRMIKSLFTLLVENRFCIIVFLSFLTDLKVGYIFHK